MNEVGSCIVIVIVINALYRLYLGKGDANYQKNLFMDILVF